MEAEEDLIAAVKQILKALEESQGRNLSDDTRKVLADLGSKLSSIAQIPSTPDDEQQFDDKPDDDGAGVNEIELELERIQAKILNWEKDQSAMIWDYGPQEANEYLKAVDEVRKLAEALESRTSDGDSRLLCRAHDVLQTSMVRLEDEFRHLLVQNRQPFEPEHMSFRSSEEDPIDSSSIVSSGDDSVEEVVQRESITGRPSEEYVIDIVHPDVIPDLKSIANLMFNSNYGRECSQVFVNVQKDTLDDCLFILEVEKLSIEDVLKMEWTALNSKIRRWMRSIKVFVRRYLKSAKILTDQIFSDQENVSSICFADLSKTAVFQLLNFGEAIAIGPHQPEKLIRILDMYEVLSDLIPDMAALYSDEPSGSCVCTECQDVLKRLGECAKWTFLEFEKAVASNVSANPFPGGGVHPLTRYVMNYIKTLIDYHKSLQEVLKELPEKTKTAFPEQDEEEGTSPISANFRSLISTLESNLDDKSKLYRDESLQCLFLMNNVHYMAEKVKGSELRTVMGDDWIRKHNWKFQQHAMNYERATWSSILALLKDEGIQNPGSNSISRTLLNKRLQSFYAAFEEVYKSQTGWTISDVQLRDDLRISTSLKVIQAYRTFVGRHINHISEKHIKYSADDLEDYLLDLFEGSQKSLHGGHKK